MEKTAYEIESEKAAFRSWLMAYYGGMTMQQVAGKYGVTTGTVSRTIAKARDRLRRVLRYCSPALLRSTMKEE